MKCKSLLKYYASAKSCLVVIGVQILTPFMLRRLKADVDFVIPPKREIVVYAQMSAEQQEMYRCILNKTIAQLVKAPSETPVRCSVVNVMLMICLKNRSLLYCIPGYILLRS